MIDNRDKITEEDKERLLMEIEHVMTVGHGEIVIKIADHKLMFCKADAQFEFHTNGKKG